MALRCELLHQVQKTREECGWIRVSKEKNRSYGQSGDRGQQCPFMSWEGFIFYSESDEMPLESFRQRDTLVIMV